MAVSSSDLAEILAEVDRLRAIVQGKIAEAKSLEAAVGAVSGNGPPAPRTRLR